MDAERPANLPLQSGQLTKLGARALDGLQLLPDLLDQLARAAEIDRALTVFFAIVEAVIRPERFDAATSIGGNNAALTDEECRI